jgi:hypothetical protein
MNKKYVYFFIIILITIRINAQSSGTGFLISNDGYIATCYHVIENSESIIIKGINGNTSRNYNAKVVLTDKSNDLAVLKINCSLNNEIPYSIKWKVSDVGEGVFTLGYPLKTTMGEEIKLTNGIISSKSGFRGDKSTYQISAPIQPGNSGGPLFDNKGFLIGITNAKHKGAENVNYAIKTNVLKNLIESSYLSINLTKNNLLSNYSLSEKVKKIKNNVLIIEVENNSQISNNGENEPIKIYAKIKAKVKDKPDVFGSIRGYVSVGESIQAIGKNGEYWKVFYNGDIGYVHDLYIKETRITSIIKYSLPEKYRRNNVQSKTKTLAKLRDKPSPLANIITNIPKGETIYIVGFKDNYWKVFHKGKLGYLMDGLYFETTYKMMRFK